MASQMARIEAAVARLEAAGFPFERISVAPWITDIEGEFGTKLPQSFGLLFNRYRFPSFDAGEIEVFANLNDRACDDIGRAPFCDRFMSPWLITHRFLQFGRPMTGHHDPICFDLRSNSNEPPVVRLDHEDILLERKKIRISAISPSFLDLLESAHRPG
jgi:hypothetical protein